MYYMMSVLITSDVLLLHCILINTRDDGGGVLTARMCIGFRGTLWAGFEKVQNERKIKRNNNNNNMWFFTIYFIFNYANGSA